MSTRALQFDVLLNPILDYRTASICSGYTVYFYSAGTSTAKNVWTELEKTNAYTSRTIGSDGTVEVFGDGIYKIIIKDIDGTTVYEWDNVKVQANTYTVQDKSDTYTATADDDLILVDTTVGNVTINIATVLGFTHPISFKIKTGANNIVLNPYSDETIDGNATLSVTPEDDSCVLHPDTANETWRRVTRFPGLTTTVAELNDIVTKSDVQTITGVKTMSGANVITFANEGVHILDTNASHDLIIKPGSNLTADRIFTITTGDAARTLTTDQDLDLSTTAYPRFLGLRDASYNIALPTNGMAAAKFMLGNSSTILWMYLNAAPPGWKALSTGADMVLAVAGGTQAYNVNGGNPDSVATWSRGAITLSAAQSGVPAHQHSSDATYGTGAALTRMVASSEASQGSYAIPANSATAASSSHEHNTDWRPKASVGKLFQLDTA